MTIRADTFVSRGLMLRMAETREISLYRLQLTCRPGNFTLANRIDNLAVTFTTAACTLGFAWIRVAVVQGIKQLLRCSVNFWGCSDSIPSVRASR